MNLTDLTPNELGFLASERLQIIKNYHHKEKTMMDIQDCIDELKEILFEYEDRIK